MPCNAKFAEKDAYLGSFACGWVARKRLDNLPNRWHNVKDAADEGFDFRQFLLRVEAAMISY